MAFVNRSLEDVNQLIVSGLEVELNTKFKLLPKSFIRVLAKVMAAIYITLYKQQGWIFLQIFVATASYDEVEIMGHKIRPLVMWGELGGIGAPNAATQFEAKIKVVANGNLVNLLQGTQFLSSSTGKIYITTDNYSLIQGDNYIKVKCAEAGAVGNLDLNDELMTVSPISNIERKAYVTEIIVNADNEESEESYRNRVIQRWKNPPQGGALGDYRKWANEVNGVLQSYIYKDDNSAAGVLIYVEANSENRIPSDELLLKVGQNCDKDPYSGQGRKPIGAVIDPDGDGSYKNVRPCIVTGFDVYIENYEGDSVKIFENKIKNEIAEYFLNKEPFVRGLTVDKDRNDRISTVNISGVANTVANSLNGHFDNVILKLNGVEVQAYILDRGELASLNRIYVNGVEA